MTLQTQLTKQTFFTGIYLYSLASELLLLLLLVEEEEAEEEDEGDVLVDAESAGAAGDAATA